MKIFRQLILIVGIYLVGEFLAIKFNLPIPGSLVGMLLLLLGLCTKIINVKHVEEITEFFMNHLAFFFIPAGVGIMRYFDILKSNFIEILVICIVCTAVVIVTTGKIVEYLVNKQKGIE